MIKHFHSHLLVKENDKWSFRANNLKIHLTFPNFFYLMRKTKRVISIGKILHIIRLSISLMTMMKLNYISLNLLAILQGGLHLVLSVSSVEMMIIMKMNKILDSQEAIVIASINNNTKKKKRRSILWLQPP